MLSLYVEIAQTLLELRPYAARARVITAALLVCLMLAFNACGEEASPEPSADGDQDYPEGTVRMEIELLDVGLLKGHSYAGAKEGWTAVSMKVGAVDHEGVRWPVLEPEFTGIGTATASEFFEVTLQELPRGQQITVTTTVIFENQAGDKVERTAVDRWPP